MPDAALQRDNDQWLRDLSDSGRRMDLAQSDLRDFLRQGLARSLNDRGLSTTLIEDFAQDAMLKVLAGLDGFRGDSQFTTWAMAIAIRTAFSELRRARWRDRSLDELIQGGRGEGLSNRLVTPPEAEDSLHRRQVMAVMNDVIRYELSAKQRTVLLAEISEVPKTVLAERLETNSNALYKLAHDARRRLRERMLATGLTENEIRAAFGG